MKVPSPVLAASEVVTTFVHYGPISVAKGDRLNIIETALSDFPCQDPARSRGKVRVLCGQSDIELRSSRVSCWEGIIAGIHDQEPVTGLTHSFYKYPARFSPSFARQVILAFSKPGDLVFDPFMGGGTTLVEACALGRRAIGTDINSLAVFLAETKTSVFSRAELNHLQSWACDLIPELNLRRRSARAREWAELGYHRNINGRRTWPIRKTLELALRSVRQLVSEREQKFARCALLRTAQWALDCREDIPSAREIRGRLLFFVDEMIGGALNFALAVRENGTDHETVCLHRSVIGIETEPALRQSGTPTLILTSPPYPGVHVLYHRWQVLGRRETPAPFWIAGTLDGSGASFYTFGDRGQRSQQNYYRKAKEAFASICRVAGKRTMVVQMVAFGDPTWQLPLYLEMMERAGFGEQFLPKLANGPDGRVWRSVPNRKWYADKHGNTGGSKEVVLFHKINK